MTHRLDRRPFLRCVGGLLALPLLESCQRSTAAPAIGSVASPLTGAPAKRLVVMGVWDGVIPRLWYPAGPSSTAFTLGPMLSDLATHQANLLLLKGVDNVAAETTIGTNGHAEGVASVLTGISPVEDPKGSNTWHGQGQSVDQAIADHFSKSGTITRFSSLQVGTGHTGGGYGSISYAGKDQPLNPNGSPDQLFSLMFQNAQQGAAEIAKARARRSSVVDGATSDYGRLSSKVSGEDKRRIDAHLQSLRDLEMRLATATACDPTGHKPMLPAMADYGQIWTAFLDLAVLALSCDLTRIMTFSFDHAGGGGVQFPWLNINDDWHEVSHSVVPENAVANPTGGVATDKFVKIHQWFSQKLKTFIDQLQAVTDADGSSIFDSTVIVQASELGFNHTHNDIPFLVMAGAKTPIKAGQYVNLAPARPIYVDSWQASKVDPAGTAHNKLLVTLLHAFGVPTDAFGDPNIPAGNVDAQVLKG
jgi:Protein of unknown function (DUF1552)